MGSLVGLDKVFSIETPQSWPAEPADINFHVLHVFGDFEPRQKMIFFENVGFSSTARDGDLEKADPLRHFPGRASLEDWLCLARLGWLWCNGFKTGHSAVVFFSYASLNGTSAIVRVFV